MLLPRSDAPALTSDGETAAERRERVRRDRVARYERMVEIRKAEAQIRELHAAGKAWGTTHCADGQEAVAVGLAAAARPTDLIAAGHRSHALGLALGVTPEALLAENLGRADGAVGGIGGSIHLTDLTVGLYHTFTIIGTQIVQAAGIGLANQVLGTDHVAIALFGDGAVNIGAFHEGLNLASVWQLPVVFICENNQYAEYTRFDAMTPIPDVAARGEAYAMPHAIVDGQDVDATEVAIAEALKRARDGGGPSLLELKTYRFLGHSRSDQATYRPAGEAERWPDPITSFADRLKDEGLLDDALIREIDERVQRRIDRAALFAEASPVPGEEVIFANVYAPDRSTA